MRLAWRIREEREPRRHAGRSRRPFRSIRPQLEMLEDRLAPSTSLPGHDLPKIHVQAPPILAVIIAKPITAQAPFIPINSFNSDPFTLRPAPVSPYAGSFVGYLVDMTADNSIGLKSDPVDAQVAREFPGDNPADSGAAIGNQIGTQNEIMLLEKLKKTKGTATPSRPAPKKMPAGELDHTYRPKARPSPQPGQQRDLKKNFTLGIRIQPTPFQSEELAARLLAKRSPGSIFLAVLVMGWGIKRPRFRTRNRWQRSRPRNRRRWEFPEHVFQHLESCAAARGPP